MGKEKHVGIQPLMYALVHQTLEQSEDERRMLWQADAPTVYAEARLGVASEREIEEMLAETVNGVKKGRYEESTPFLRQWLEERKGKLDLDNLVELLRKSTKKSAAMIHEPAVYGTPTNSEHGTLVLRVKSRTTGTDRNTLRLWDVEFANYEIVDGKTDPNFTRICQCGEIGKNINRKRLWMESDCEGEFLDDLVRSRLTSRRELGTKLHLACYHEAAAITALNLQRNRGYDLGIPAIEDRRIEIAFDFTDRWDLVFEGFARRYRFKQDYAEIDAFLFSHDVVSPYFKDLMEQGKVCREAVKKSRHFEPMAKEIIMGLHKKLLSHGYKYAGFAREFIGVSNRKKSYETIGIVYEKGDVSYHIVYDNNFWMPFVVEKHIGISNKDKPNVTYKRNPVRLLVRNASWKEIDDRTGKVAVIKVHQPSNDVLQGINGAKEKYKGYLSYFKR